MSYDVYLVIDAGGDEPVSLGLLDRNYTYNISPMILDAMGTGLSDLDGIEAGRAAGHLQIAVEALRADPEKYRAMNPPNGWGDYEGCLAFMVDILEACRKAPRARLKVV